MLANGRRAGPSSDLFDTLAEYRRAEAVVQAADEAVRNYRTSDIEMAALRASEDLVRCRVRLAEQMKERGWEMNDATLAQLSRDALLLELPDGALPG